MSKITYINDIENYRIVPAHCLNQEDDAKRDLIFMVQKREPYFFIFDKWTFYQAVMSKEEGIDLIEHMTGEKYHDPD